MAAHYIEIPYQSLAFLVVMFMGIILFQSVIGLSMARDFTIAGIRMFGQLLIMGTVLWWVFSVKSLIITLSLVILMVLVAAHTSRDRVIRSYNGPVRPSMIPFLIAVSIAMSVSLILGVGIILRPTPWFDPQYIIPLVGMIMGNSMNVSSLSAERFVSSVVREVHLVETLLGLGLSPHQACSSFMKSALKASLMPTINTMMVVGIVSIPGMMTGQILAGVSPELAVRYQMMIHTLILITSVLASWITVRGLYTVLFNRDDQLRWIAETPKGG